MYNYLDFEVYNLNFLGISPYAQFHPHNNPPYDERWREREHLFLPKFLTVNYAFIPVTGVLSPKFLLNMKDGTSQIKNTTCSEKH